MKFKKLGSLLLAVITLTSVNVLQLPEVKAAEATVYKNSLNGVCNTVIKNSSNYEVSYPFLKSGASANNIKKINNRIEKVVEEIVGVFKNRKNYNSTLDFELMRFDQNTLSFLFTYTDEAKNGTVFNNTKGLTFSLKNGEEVSLRHYFNKSEVRKRAKNGLSYIYGLESSKDLSTPDTYYVADDNNIVAIYNASTLGKTGNKYYDIDLSAIDFVAPYKPKASKETITSNEKIYSGSTAEYINSEFSGIVTGEEVSIRAEANTNSEVKGYYRKGEKVAIKAAKIGSEHNWYKVKRSGESDSNWIAADYCKIINAPEARIRGTWVRSRDGVGLNSNITGYFNNYEKVQILTSKKADSHTWDLVLRANGEMAWVSSEYCK